MGGSVDSLRFSEVDYSGAYNNFGGWYNEPNISNENAFAALKVDGSITEWGSSDSGGTGAPSDSGYTKIYSNRSALSPPLKPMVQSRRGGIRNFNSVIRITATPLRD
jgi:hypothetical protein